MALTVRQLAEKLGNEREHVERGIVEYCPVPVFTTDRAGRWTSYNVPMQRLLGATESQFLGDKWFLKLAPNAVDDVSRAWTPIFEQRVPEAKLKVILRLKCMALERTVGAFISLIRLPPGTYLGFMVPVCDSAVSCVNCGHEVNCPMHVCLLHNLEPKNSAPRK